MDLEDIIQIIFALVFFVGPAILRLLRNQKSAPAPPPSPTSDDAVAREGMERLAELERVLAQLSAGRDEDVTAPVAAPRPAPSARASYDRGAATDESALDDDDSMAEDPRNYDDEAREDTRDFDDAAGESAVDYDEQGGEDQRDYDEEFVEEVATLERTRALPASAELEGFAEVSDAPSAYEQLTDEEVLSAERKTARRAVQPGAHPMALTPARLHEVAFVRDALVLQAVMTRPRALTLNPPRRKR